AVICCVYQYSVVALSYSHALFCSVAFLTLRPPPRSTLFPTRRSSDLRERRHPDLDDPRRPRHQAGLGRRAALRRRRGTPAEPGLDRKSTRLNSSHVKISYAVFCLKKKKQRLLITGTDNLHSILFIYTT